VIRVPTKLPTNTQAAAKYQSIVTLLSKLFFEISHPGFLHITKITSFAVTRVRKISIMYSRLENSILDKDEEPLFL
jgi:hypothetical protein